jgi:hypothetical protein
MKINFPAVLLAMACLTASGHACAQSPTRANIPFEFMVGQKALPAGQYSISNLTDRVIELRNMDKQVSILVSTTATDYVSGKPHVLVFRGYDGQYFLHEVRGGLGEFALDIPPSKLEKETQRQIALHGKQQGAEIALR